MRPDGRVVRTQAGRVDPVLHRILAHAPLSGDEINLIGGLAAQRTRAQPGDELAGGAAGDAPKFLLSGWAACQSMLCDGRRQIHRLFVPGDLFGAVAAGDHPGSQVVALTQVATADAAPVIEAVRAGKASVLGAVMAEAEREHLCLLNGAILRLGRMTAYERMVHLLLEVGERLAVAGIGDGRRFPMPLTQEMLSDVLGLSIVHTNRVLQRLRRERLIELRSGIAVLLVSEALVAIVSGEVRRANPHLPKADLQDRAPTARAQMGASISAFRQYG